jgi:hypothetical protein
MIGKNAQIFCCEDLSLVENYKQAVNDNSQLWDCHHHLELSLNLSMQELKDRNLYYNRPASELIFLTHSDHMKLHSQGENHPMWNKHHSEEAKNKQSIAGKKRYEDPKERKKQSEKLSQYWSDENNRNEQSIKLKEFYSDPKNRKMIADNTTGRTWMNNGYVRAYPKTQEEIDYYTSLGYHPGFKITKGEI